MARDVSDATPIGARRELVEWVASGEKPTSEWRLGTEHEKIPFRIADRSPVAYEGEGGIRALLDGLAGLNGWEPIVEADGAGGHPIGLADAHGGGAISLEPGGQFELSGAPVRTLHETKAELGAHIAQVKRVGEGLGIGFLTLGLSPLWTLAEAARMPKRRYDIMRRYMPLVGGRGLDMMHRTATVQVNLDYASEADMVKKLRVSLALQPVATALFANSPFIDGRPSGALTDRSRVWRDTDPHRTGMMPEAFAEGFGYEAYVDWALDVPMYFVKRGETYHDVAGSSFRDLLAGRHPALPGEVATRSDWANHVSTVFPEVRLKRYLEMRGADLGPPEMIVALSAFWVGLLYDEAALDGAWDLVRAWSAEERERLRADVPVQALAARIAGRSVAEIVRDALALSRAGLARRALANGRGEDESIYLNPLDAIAGMGRTLAEHWLDRYHGPWNGSVLPAFGECVF